MRTRKLIDSWICGVDVAMEGETPWKEQVFFGTAAELGRPRTLKSA
jgi:hypothetical protein